MAKSLAKINSSVSEFNLNLDKFIEKIVPEKHLLLQKLVGLQFLKRVVELNPVGNAKLWKPLPSGKPRKAPKGYVGGRSRANWQVQFNSFNNDEVPIISVPAVIGAAEIEAVDKPFGVIWVFNNVPYIERLENGHSTQAPAGMVGIALAEVEAGLGTL
jgi:hypothetical protein